MTGIVQALVGGVLLGAVNTFGDFFWEWMNLRHRVAFGVAHGALLLFCLGLYLGILAGRPIAGAVGGIISGTLAACVFYALAPMMRLAAMFPAWVALWLLIGLLDGVVLRRGRVGQALARGAIAGAVSGLAFYAISGIWTRPSPGGPRYLVNFASWTIAFTPGFLALLVARTTSAASAYTPQESRTASRPAGRS
jgi:hypothetical protein